MKFSPIVIAAIICSTAGLAQAADPAKGAVVFKKCLACHTATEATNKVGPTLQGVVGRPIATIEGYKYSGAMKDYGAGKVWDEAALAAYLAAPKKVVKGTYMAFAGLKKPEDIADVIAYLKNPPAD
ncbi:c-type cytochrome [Rhizobium sp.]